MKTIWIMLPMIGLLAACETQQQSTLAGAAAGAAIGATVADDDLTGAVIGGGCSGLQYKMDLVDGPRDRDILVPSNGVNVVIDPKSALFVSGSELDFSDDLQQGGFKVSNPNAVVTCSCGESFAA